MAINSDEKILDKKLLDLNLSVKIHTDFIMLEKKKYEWNNLVNRSFFPNIFLTFEWVLIWWRSFGKKHKLNIIEVYEKERLIAIIPLYVGSLYIIPFIKVSSIKFIGDGGPVYPDYLGPIVDKEHLPLMDIIVELIVNKSMRVSTIYLSSMLVDINQDNDLTEIFKKKYFTDIEEKEFCPYISLPKDYSIFLSHLNRRRRESIRRQLRKAKKNFNLRLECNILPDSVDSSFSYLRKIFRKSVRGEDHNICFNRDEYFDFHKKIAKTFSKNGWYRLYILWFDNNPVAFVYGYLFNNKFWYYQTSYDKNYRKWGVGSVAIQLIIKSIIEYGVKEFDFLRGDEDYKFHFANNQRKIRSIIVFPKKKFIYYFYKCLKTIKIKIKGFIN